MENRSTFLSAHWGNLLLLNYATPERVLAPRVPPGWELDRFQDSPYVSLVAFQFTRTRVFGVRWPGFTNFPEINLRFYVRQGERRGVCFVREFVPSRLVAALARQLYNEPYAKGTLRESVERRDGELRVHYELGWRGASLGLGARAFEAEAWMPAEGSREHFFKEHDLGVGRSRNGAVLTYGVEHPAWRVYPVRDFTVRLDPGIYGPEFEFLTHARPDSVVLAEGSEIRVLRKGGP